MSKDQLRTISIIICTALVVILAGCASSQGMVKQNDVILENIDSKSARISRTYLIFKDDSLVLHGELTQRMPSRGSIPGHLHVELIGFNGKVMKEARIGYKRNSFKSRYAHFSLPLPASIAPGSTIRITHHDMRSHVPELSGSPWRDVDVAE